ncbi:MAG: 2-succinyl-6-hydroxy-2,4-cyclohexadiene-1-carboxylate synthase [bacterium]
MTATDYPFHYIDSGHKNSPPILFLHGFMGCADDWQSIVSVLSNDFYCIAVDLPGHGKTPINKTDSMGAYADGLAGFFEKLRIQKCALVGYSMGGRLALYLAIRYPKIFQSVILESASPGLKTALERRARIEHDNMLAAELEKCDFAAFLDSWYRQPLFADMRRHPNYQALLHRRMQNNPQNLAASLRCMGTGRQPTLWHELAGIELPVLLLAGERDKKFVAIHTEINAHCKSAAQTIIRDCGHNIHFEVPEIYAKHIRKFIRKIKEETQWER